jgi:O-antigen/teichoic acid export membrane protein
MADRRTKPRGKPWQLLPRWIGLLTGETRGLMKDSVAVGIGQMSGQISMLVVLAMVGRSMGIAELGKFWLITSFVGFIGSFIDVRTELAVVSLGARELKDPGRLSSLIRLAYLIDFSTGVLAFLIVLALHPLLGDAIVGAGTFPSTAIFAITLLVSFGDDTAKALLALLGRFRTLAGFGVVLAIGRVALVGLMVATGPTLLRAITGFVLLDVLAALILPWVAARAYRRHVGERLAFRGPIPRDQVKTVTRMVFDTNIIGYAKAFANRVPILILGLFEGPAKVGLYKVATVSASTLVLPTDMATRAMHSRLSRLWADGRVAEMRTLVKQATLLAAGPLVLLAAGIFVFRDSVFRIFGGSADAPAALSILAIALVGNFVNSALFWNASLLLAAGESKALARIYTISVLGIRLPLLLTLIPWLGPVGAAIAFVVPVVNTNIWLTIRGRRILRTQPSPPVPSTAVT